MKINKNIEITNESNIDLMKRYSDNHFDIAIVDPPYGIKRSGQTKTVCKNPKHNRKEYKQKEWDNERPSSEYWNELFRVSKNQIVWGANYFTEFLPPSMGWLFWDKGQNLSMSDGELAFTSYDKAMRRIIMNRAEIARDGSIHPTQKPVKLYELILKKYAEKDFKILDTHFGSGSHGVAIDKINKYDKLNLHLTACELDKEYYQNSINWLKHETAIKSLF